MENSEIKSDEKLSVFKETRAFLASSFRTVLGKVLLGKENISEAQLRDLWIEEIQKNNALSKEGWYQPPPKGVCILFGTDRQAGESNRINFKSIRPKEMWPQDDVFLDRKNGLLLAYASNVDLKTGIIGDFGITLYFGNDGKVRQHLKTGYSINKEIFDKVRVGMRLKDVYSIADACIKEKGLRCEHKSITDTAASSNMGHTIPASFEQWTLDELRLIQSDDWESAKNQISSKRKFTNSVEELAITPGFAFTIEPRPFNPNNLLLPQAFFHSVCLIHEDSSKELAGNHKELFSLAGMDYMLGKSN